VRRFDLGVLIFGFLRALLLLPWYQRLVRPLLFIFPPERAQSFAEKSLVVTPAWKIYGAITGSITRVAESAMGDNALRNPVGLAAGFDKQCQYLESLAHFGFGYLVGGSVTLHPRPGNLEPRLLRRAKDESLVNSMGFPSDGLSVIASRLENMTDRIVPIYISIAAMDEFEVRECMNRLGPLADAVELNISSPNSQGVRQFQTLEGLRKLLAIVNERRSKPVFVKLPPYFNERDRENVIALMRECVSSGVSGVTAINTVPVENDELAIGRGGLSGRAILPDMLRILADLRREADSNFIINACGGIATGDDAWQALQAGADTVQLYTSLVYRGPTIVAGICDHLRRKLDQGP
jgi:dihydroorotate dehydrogenase